MQSTQRYVIVGILTLAVLLGLTLSHGFRWIWVQFGLDDPLLAGVRELALTSLLGYGVAAIAAAVCFKHAATYQLATEVVDELTKVTWPSREETGNATVVVVVAVILSSVYLGAFDAFWLALTDWMLGIEAPPQG